MSRRIVILKVISTPIDSHATDQARAILAGEPPGTYGILIGMKGSSVQALRSVHSLPPSCRLLLMSGHSFKALEADGRLDWGLGRAIEMFEKCGMRDFDPRAA